MKHTSIYDFQRNPIEKPGYILEFEDGFEANRLDTDKWIPYYLPQWSSRKKSCPNYRFQDGKLVLEITEDQQPWCPEFNGEVKCSSIQTGLYAGPLGTDKGQHKFNKACVVREEQVNQKTYIPLYGYFEIRAKVPDTPSNVAALWMIGYEEEPEQSAEICILEIKGWNIEKESSIIGYGVHKFNDPDLKEDFREDRFDIDVTQFHIYAAEWTHEKVDFYIDNKLIRTINQSPTYPMQFMLNIYELPTEKEKTGRDLIYPKEFTIDYIRGYRKI
jgi:hypothetical protein